MEEVIVIDEEAARIAARRRMLGMEVLLLLFGSDVRLRDEQRAAMLITDLGRITERLGLEYVEYEKRGLVVESS